jgi:succinate-semialdehyde dehydrogenase/glutarate-semialdehyde dehydrogenase
MRPATLTDAFLAQLVARVPSTSGGSWKLTEVYTGDLLVELPQSTPEDVAHAYEVARAAQKEWAARPLRERLAVFKRAHTLFIDHAETTTDLIQAESGKNRRMAIEETCDPVMVMSHYLKRAPRLLRSVKRGGPVPLVSSSTEIRVPKGVVGIIAPWNFPFATGISDSISALMAGNGIVLKPDNKTALSPLYGVAMRPVPGRLRRGARRRPGADRPRQLRDVHRLDRDRPGDR